MAHSLTIIVITKNEEKMIGDCLISAAFADQIIVVDSGNTDQTNDIALKHGAQIVTSSGTDYSQFRNNGLTAASGEWVLYLDADERITPALRAEIVSTIARSKKNLVFAILRQNMFLGKHMHYGGWSDDYVIRLFKKSVLKGWHNPLHEEPDFEGDLGKLQNPLIHFSHRDLTSMMEKTLSFTQYEAQLRFDTQHPPVVVWRFIRVMFTEFWKRFVVLQAWRDGAEGVIDGLFQVFNMFIIYARLWEMQLKPPSRPVGGKQPV
jgi:glycosyltransferase involved in cell wall biosynthesis